MSKLKTIREFQNLTQEELAEKSGTSVRTIQRIEAGITPKGYTLRVLAKALVVNENELLTHPSKKEKATEEPQVVEENVSINYAKLKLINLSAIPFTIIPPLNILVPLILMVQLKQKNAIAKQLISIQILWTILAPIVFMLGIFLKLGNQFTLVLMIIIVLSNIFVVLRNAIAIDQSKKLHYKLNFNMI